MYADYAYYKDSFGGALTAEEFNRYARKAERFLNYVVMGKNFRSDRACEKRCLCRR